MTTPTIDKCKANYRQSSYPWVDCNDCNHAKHIRNREGTYWFVCDVLDIEIADGRVCDYYCNPCEHCRHLYDDSDPSVGMYGYGCAADDDGLETNGGEGKFPCPSFSPFKASDGLFDQLADEEMARQYLEDEE